MINQTDPSPILLEPSSVHLPLVIIIDNSSNMNESRLAQLNDSLNDFIETIAKDDYQSKIVDLLILSVYDSTALTSKFMPACLQTNEQIKLEIPSVYRMIL